MGMLIAYLLGILTASKPKGPYAVHNTNSSDTTERQPPFDRPISVVCIPPTKSKEESAQEQKKEKREARKFWIEFISAILLLGYFGVTILIWCANKEAADATQKQLEMMDRPWVSVEVLISSPLTYDSKGGMHIGFTFVPKNVGHSPAQNVSIGSKLVSGIMDAEVRESQKRACKNSPAQDQDEWLKYALFPGDSYPQKMGMEISSKELDSRWSSFELSQGVDMIPVVLIGCVDYTYESSHRHHQTGFAFDVLMKDGGIVLKSKTPLPPDSLILIQHPHGGHFAN